MGGESLQTLAQNGIEFALEAIHFGRQLDWADALVGDTYVRSSFRGVRMVDGDIRDCERDAWPSFVGIEEKLYRVAHSFR